MNLVNHEVFAKIFTHTKVAICHISVAYVFAKFFFTNSFYLCGSPKFSHVRYIQKKFKILRTMKIYTSAVSGVQNATCHPFYLVFQCSSAMLYNLCVDVRMAQYCIAGNLDRGNFNRY